MYMSVAANIIKLQRYLYQRVSLNITLKKESQNVFRHQFSSLVLHKNIIFNVTHKTTVLWTVTRVVW